MIAKLSKGGSFSGAVQYIFGPGKGADCLAGMGVLFKDTPSIIRGFERQAAQNPRVSKPVGHVVLSFSPRDAARLDNRLLLSIAVEYLDRMGSRIHNLSLSTTATGNIPTCIFSSTAWATTDERSPTATTATVRSGSASN